MNEAIANKPLANFQQVFSNYLLTDSKVDTIINQVNVSPKHRERLIIYRNNVLSSLSNALADLYPVIKKLVGEDFFKAMAVEYIRQFPPTEAAMVNFAPHFADFLAHFEHTQHLPYLKDMARLELARHQAYHAKDQPSLTGEQLSAIDPDVLIESGFIIHGSTHIVSSNYPIEKIWQANQNDNEQLIDLDSGAETLLITRPKYTLKQCLISTSVTIIARALMAGDSLGDAIEKGMQADTQLDPAQAITNFIKTGFLVSIRPAAS